MAYIKAKEQEYRAFNGKVDRIPYITRNALK
jgi:hypothetical protein